MDGLAELPSFRKKPPAPVGKKQFLDVGDGASASTKPTTGGKGKDETPKNADVGSAFTKRRSSINAEGLQNQHAGEALANAAATKVSSNISTSIAIRRLQDTRPAFPVIATRIPVAGRWAPRDDDNTSIVRSLLEMVTFRGGPTRIRSLQQINDMMSAAPKLSSRACEDLIDLKGIPVMIALLKSQELAAQCVASKILQKVASYGYHKHILELPASLPAIKHLLQVDSQEANAAGASLMAAIKPTPPFFETLPALAKILNFKSVNARVDAACAMHGLITTPELSYDIKAYQDGKLIEQVLHHMYGNPSERVRELCASILSTMSGLSSKHRIKILRNDGLRIFIEQLNDQSAAIVSNCMSAILNMALEEKALNVLISQKLEERIAAISGALDGSKYHPKLRDQAAQALNRFNSLAKIEPAKRLPIRELTTEQDLLGLSFIFTFLPTIFVCRIISRVSTAWKAAAMKPLTWTNLELRNCSFLTDQKLMDFLSNVPLSSTRHLVLSTCKGLRSGIFLHLAKSMTARLQTLDFSECNRVKDEAVVTIFKTSQNVLREVNLSGCGALTNKAIFALTVHLEASLHKLTLERCSWLHDDAIMLLAGQCRHLHRISISSCSGITAEGIKALHFSRSLREIDISLNTAVTDDGLKRLARSMNLTEISISGCENVSSTGASHLKAFTGLTVLDISGNFSVSEETCAELVRNCTKLTSLKLMMVPSINDDTLRAVASTCKLLSVVDLSYCPLITDIGLRGIVRNCTALKDLNLAWCEMLTSKGIRSISDNCKALESLNLSQCAAINDVELMGFTQCSRLERMTLVSCNRLSPYGIDTFVLEVSSKSLKYLDLRGTLSDIMDLRTRPDHIRILTGSTSSFTFRKEDSSELERNLVESPSLSPSSSPRSPRQISKRPASRAYPSSHHSFASSPISIVMRATAAMKLGNIQHKSANRDNRHGTDQVSNSSEQGLSD